MYTSNKFFTKVFIIGLMFYKDYPFDLSYKLFRVVRQNLTCHS